jgi:CDP-diacylglycerol--glycerol-3-phosphate 3-phosphatidyltransferase
MNLPNKLTLSRFALTAVFLGAMFSEAPYHETLALVVFVVAGITDYFDGMIARRDHLITNFGALMDPLADKILVCSAFIAFVGRDLMPAWMVVLIVARELAITGLRLLAASKNVVLAAEGYGKHKTTWQLIAIISILIWISCEQWGTPAYTFLRYPILDRPWFAAFTELAKWLAVLFTIMSGGIYLWRNREIYLRDM